ncbi:helix-turn-helix domain-containing protein [Flavonifractor plautii]|uniref:helix-turn-helix domain-containing protein n=1 Tax=Flavonifractor plautii TaxID=292800 RepID=UPI00195679C6|nr:helix-turn-helix transcriptional regulator [Flavonifractor plautii]MBM6664258.1 helix-turn-helix transcriptional regulator [Flavonifractor plautii]
MDAQLFVQNIKYYCNLRDTKPTVACRESGVGSSFINNVERGQTPSVAKVQMLAEYLGVTTSDLLGEKKEPTVQDDGLSEGEQALMTLFRQLTPDQQEMVLRMVQAAADKL